ncbi:BLUF domain-containing protein [Phenylobacterium immobile]|uniref:BLUF domain-containing protein n=1 Tax=Phenylobacterium immobile TaxID=21 RepID=UPI000B06F44A|nr:BLUF domain-containing protein [Phenylobacterium immobile]
MKQGSIQRLLYVSRITARAAGPLPSTMEDILVESHGRNAALGVTGFLWSDGVHFCQVLEGADAAVDAVFASILQDDRHKDVRLRLQEASSDRKFDRWSMCGMTLSDLDESVIDGGDLGGDLYLAPAEDVIAMLAHLCAVHGAALEAQHRRIVAATAGL